MAADGYKNIWEAFAAMRSDIGMLWEEMGFSMVHYGISLILTFLIGPFASMVILFGAITLGQLSKKHRGIMGVLAYLGALFLEMIISSIVQLVNTFRFSYEMASSAYGSVTINMASTYDARLITVVVMAAVLYGVSYYILTKKFNME